MGDIYFDGKHNLITIIDKKSADNSKNITVIIKALVEKTVNNAFILGEDQIISNGKNINIMTNHFIFDGYTVSDIN